MAGKRVLVLGGGFGGAMAARTARSLLPVEHDVTLLDRNRQTHLCGANPLLIVGQRASTGVGRSLGRLSNFGVNFVQAGITRIDTAGRRVVTDAGAFEYDFLVIALGATYDWDAVPNSRSAFAFYDIASARRLRTRLNRLKRGRVAIAVAGAPIKCPPAPFETAMILAWEFRRRGIRRDVELAVSIPEPAPLAVAGPEASQRLRVEMDKRGIELRTGAGLAEVAPGGREAQLKDGSAIAADVLITVPLHVVPAVVAESGITGGKPWIPVDTGTLETSTTNVFAIGDVNMVPFAEGKALPKAGVFASGEGENVGRRIASRILGTQSPEVYDGSGKCYLAFSGTQSAMVGGEFLAKPGPQIALDPPTAAGMRSKERFERDWKRFRI